MQAVPPSLAVLLAARLGDLRDLVAWPPVASLAERVTDALRGSGPLYPDDVSRARAWALRWAAFRPEVRSFYAQCAPLDHDAHAALWSILDTPAGRTPPDVAMGRAHAAWERHVGGPCPFDLAPRGGVNPSTTRTT